MDSRDGAEPKSSGSVACDRLTLAYWRALTYAVRHRWIPLLWTEEKLIFCPDARACVTVLVTTFQWSPQRSPATPPPWRPNTNVGTWVIAQRVSRVDGSHRCCSLLGKGRLFENLLFVSLHCSGRTSVIIIIIIIKTDLFQIN